jgi:hypothetical protein
MFKTAAAALVAAVCLCSQALAEKRVALVVGNDRYQNIWPLQKAVNDSQVIGETLKGLGFQVIAAQNLTRRAMAETLLDFDRMVEPGDTALFFFAGHGFEIKGENYLLPVDVPAATDGQEELVRDASFPAQRVIDRLQARGARTAVVVLDACRNNPFERPGKRSVSGSAGLAAMTPSNGVFIIFSAGAKESALDRLSDQDTHPNSVFTRHFVRELTVPGLSLAQIAKRTQTSVHQTARGIRHEQTPAYYDQVVGDIYLKPGDGGAAPPAPQMAALTPAPTQREISVVPEPVNAPIADFMRHNTGWSVTLSFADPVGAISWRMGESGPWKETGFLDALDPRTRKRMPNPSIQLDADTPPGTLEVRYVDLRGQAMGPFPIRFDPVEAIERGQRRILEMTASSWLSMREFNGLLLYYTHLVSYRCAIREVRIGFDGALPSRVVPLPPCNLKDPSAIPSSVQPYMKLPTATKSVSVELTYRDGTTSEVKTYRR